MLFETVKVTAFFVEDGRVEDICEFVGFDGVGDDAFADSGFLAVHAKIQPFQCVLQQIRNLFERIAVVAENAIIVTVANDFVG